MIEEARRRARRRRLGAAIVLAIAVGVVLGLLLSQGSSSGTPAGAQRLPAERAASTAASASPAMKASGLRLVPALDGGELGWEFVESSGGRVTGGSCCGLLTHEAQTLDGSRSGASKEWMATVLTGPFVASVSVEGRRPVRTHAGGLPFGLRFAFVRERSLNAKPVPFDAKGKRIEVRGFQTMPKRQYFEGPYAPLRWQAPKAPPAAPCEIAVSGLQGIAATAGAAVPHIKGYRSLDSPAFQSCANTEYSLRGERLNSAILLDAEHPGRTPAPLPNMTPLPGAAGVYRIPGGPGSGYSIIAKRMHGAWLLVSSHRSIPQQLTLLSHLHATLHI